jgi:hypothetical protein
MLCLLLRFNRNHSCIRTASKPHSPTNSHAENAKEMEPILIQNWTNDLKAASCLKHRSSDLTRHVPSVIAFWRQWEGPRQTIATYSRRKSCNRRFENHISDLSTSPVSASGRSLELAGFTDSDYDSLNRTGGAAPCLRARLILFCHRASLSAMSISTAHVVRKQKARVIYM